MKKIVRVTFWGLFWLVVFVLLAELTLRIKGDTYSYMEKKGKPYSSSFGGDSLFNNPVYSIRYGQEYTSHYTDPEFNYSLWLNENFFREINQEPKGLIYGPYGEVEFRVLGLGDSFTEGMGAPFDSTWLQLLPWQFERDSTRWYSSVVGGVIDNDPFFSYKQFTGKLINLQPDLVILVINATDVHDHWTRGGNERFREDGSVRFREPPKIEWWFERSHLVRSIMINILGYNWHFISSRNKEKVYQDFLEDMKPLIADFDSVSKANNADLMIAIHPMDYEVQDGKYYYDLAALKNYASNMGIPTADVLQYMVQQGQVGEAAAKQYFWPIDRHMNSQGYLVFAKAVAAKMDSLGY